MLGVLTENTNHHNFKFYKLNNFYCFALKFKCCFFSSQKYTGRNVYGILRAPRSASIESIVLSVPYRAPSSVFPSTLPGLAVMFQIAQFFRRTYISDIIYFFKFNA